MRESVRSGLALLSDWRLDLLHLAGNAAIFAGAAFWLLIPEAHAWQLLLAAISGLLIVGVFAWLHCGTLAHGVTPSPEVLTKDFRRGLRHIPSFILLLFLLLLGINYISTLAERSWQISGYFFTRLPHFMQSRIGEANFNRVVEWKFAVLTWFLLPALFLPFLSAASAFGARWTGMAAAFRCFARWRYWLYAAIAAVAGIWLPHMLITWTPGHGLSMESVSLVLRLATAYVIAVATWIAMSAIVGSFLRMTTSADDAGRDALS